MVVRKKTSATPTTGSGKRPAAGSTPQSGRSRFGLGRGRKTEAPSGQPKVSRLAQVRTVFTLTRQRDPQLVWVLLASFLIPVVVGVVIGLILGHLALWILLGILLGAFLALNSFSRRVQRTAYTEMEGKPGAAAGVVERMRGDFRVTAPVQVNRNQDLVSRVVCKAGVVLIAEGRGRGPRDLLGAEVRRVKKVAGDVPLHDIVIGTGPNEVPLPKLQATLMRKPRVLKGAQVDALDRRLKAIGGVSMPIPKGPMPRNAPRSGKMR